MPRPEPNIIQLTIDGREIRAPEGMMLVDAAKQGDVEIPYFCYEPKLGHPVGACRMCMVEIEGIPKLQTSCSTAVKDGMVVHTQTDRVRHAQHAVVEFLLVNHPLDCPVCDKGGECPLQDITFGWGLGRSRFIEPKRHFHKPLALSPLIAIDRERCILCYRCVRFSQEISEDYQLIFAERGADTFVATHNGHPYVAPFSGNIVELCPVGALTSQPYRFRARPWDIEGSAGICTLCPSQCNVEFTVRDERVMRVMSRLNPEVDDGWLCDKGRFAYQAIHSDERITRPMVRDGGNLREVSWERALHAAAALGRHHGHVGAVVGGRASNEEGFLLARLMREGLGSGDIDSRCGGPVPLDLAKALAAPPLQATVTDLEYADAVLVLGCEPLDDAPILDLRIRKGVRRAGTRLAIATARPSALDPNAQLHVRYAPGQEEGFVRALADDLAGEGRGELASFLREAGDGLVIVWGERLPATALPHLRGIAETLGLDRREGAGLLEIPAGTNGRGLREAGALPNAGPGYAPLETEGRSATAIAEATAAGALSALYLFETDPVRELPNRELWDQALHHAALVVAHAAVLTPGLKEHASVIFPAESHAEKEGTVVHPDGRIQRLRSAIGHPDEVRPGWWVLSEIAKRLGLDGAVMTSGMAFSELAEAVPFYAGLTLDAVGGRGVRWPEREQASALGVGAPGESAPPTAAVPPETTAVDLGAPATSREALESAALAASAPAQPEAAPAPPRASVAANGALRLGTYRSIWATPEVEISPALHFTIARQQVELSPADGRRLGISHGETVDVNQNGTTLRATAAIRTGVPDGTAFLADGIAEDSANELTEATIEVTKPDSRADTAEAPQ